jgi:heat shock protein HslJ
MTATHFLISALFLAACAPTGQSDPPDGSDVNSRGTEPNVTLVGPTWIAQSVVTGEDKSSIPAGMTASLTMSEDGTVDVDTGCNVGTGRFEADGETVQFSEVELTLIACDGNVARLEGALQELLGAASVLYTIDADRLTMMAGDRGLVFRNG